MVRLLFSSIFFHNSADSMTFVFSVPYGSLAFTALVRYYLSSSFESRAPKWSEFCNLVVMTSFFSVLFFLLISPFVFANTLQYKLHHRFVPLQASAKSSSSFSQLGHLVVSSAEDGSSFNPQIIPLSTTSRVESRKAGDRTGWYQVALQVKEGESDDDRDWLIATTRAVSVY